MSTPTSNTFSAPQTQSASTSTNSSNRAILQVAIIGISGFGRVHHAMIESGIQRNEFKLAAAAIINQSEEPEKCAKMLAEGVEVFEDFQEMLDRWHGKIDICFIPTGIHLHAPMTIAALQAGANVFVEKPAAATIQEVHEMQAAEQSSSRFVAVGYQTIYASETMLMKQAILTGRIGKLKAVKCMGLWPRLESYYSRNDWAGRLKLGEDWLLDSPFNNAISHQLNMICFLAGPQQNESANIADIQAELYRSRKIESPDTACIRCHSESGVPLYFFGTHSSRQTVDPEIHVVGDAGSIHWTFEQTLIHDVSGNTQTIDNECRDELRERILDCLVERTHSPKAFICDLEIASAQTRCVNGAHESSDVRAIPEQYISRHEEHEGDTKIEIKGIDELIFKAFEQEKLFSELDCPWAKPGQTIELRNYKHFPSIRQF
ncbi:Gfo/Idh/MocA family protein [Cerasicoccus arenae]|nr:Gfo/Idh/MocA family oxidoreductase [Cerasicoccus arenae]MBK1857599.1 Gfo/Idh/MocA family oxidoreductase [Cerasicoccus arenae]